MNRRVDELMGSIDGLKFRKSTETTPGAPKNDPKMSPRRPKKRSRTTRRTKKRTKTIPGPSWTPPGPICVAQRRPRGSIWEAKSAPKPTPKRSNIEAKNQEATKSDPRRFRTRLGAILGCFGAPSWAKKTTETAYFTCVRENAFFRR